MIGVTDRALSLTAELLLMAVDPGGREGSFRTIGGGLAVRAAGAGAGRAQPGRPELADRGTAAEPFRRVRRCIEEDELPGSRDWTAAAARLAGVLIHRLGIRSKAESSLTRRPALREEGR